MEYLEKIKKNPYKYGNELNVDELVELLKLSAEQYYNTNTNLISDSVYDILLDILKDKSPNHDFLKNIGAPTKSKDKVKLPYFMGSMNKFKDDKKITNWLKKYRGPYVISDKLDGISALFLYDGDNRKMYTRGDGSYGQDISLFIRYISNSSILLNIEKKIIVRGELIMKTKLFSEYEDQYDNIRNMLAGICNRKTIDKNIKEILKNVDFVCYEVIEPKLEPYEQFIYLDKIGLKTPSYQLLENINYDVLFDILNNRKKKSKYEIDGIIITDNNKHNKNSEGNPEYSFAFKTYGETKEAEVEKVEWNVSKDGLLIPIIHIKPIKLGVTIKKTTGFNGKYIMENKIGKGTIVEIVRSGDVIPYIVKIIKSSKEPEMPEEEYEWTDSGVHIKIVDMDNDSMKIKVIIKFATTLEMDNIGPGIVKKMYNAGIDTIEKFITVSKKELLQLEGIKTKMADKIIENINTKIKDVPLYKLMVASNVFGASIGEKKLKKILTELPIITDIIIDDKKIPKDLKNEIINIEGFNTLSASYVVDNLQSFKDYYDDISSYITIKKNKKIIKKNNFTGKKILFTGFRNKEWEKKLEEYGAIIVSSISKQTSLVIYKHSDKGSTKYDKAKELGIPIISEEEFSKLMK